MPVRVSEEVLRPPGEARARSRRRTRRFGASPTGATPALEARDAGAILDQAIEGLMSRLAPCLGFTLLLWLPFRQVAELLGASGLEGMASALATFAWNTMALVPLGVSTSVIVSVVGDALLDRRAPVAPGILRGLARAPGTIAILVVSQIVTLPLMVLCVVPYFLAQWLTWAAVPVYVLEADDLLTPAERARGRAHLAARLGNASRRVSRALQRSVRLSLGWPALLRWTLLAVLGQFVLGGMLELGATALVHPEARDFLREHLGLSGPVSELALGSIAGLFGAVSACLRAAILAAFYVDLRVRREGWDLELALARAEPALAARGGR